MKKRPQMKRNDALAIEAYMARVAMTREATSRKVINENEHKKRERINKLMNSYEEFCNYYFSEYCTAPLAKFHKEFALRALNPKALLVEMWPRAHAKSVNGSLMLPLWLMLKGEMRFMVLVSASNESAIQLLSDIQLQLEGNELLINDFGELAAHGSWAEGHFTTTTGVMFKALGRGQSPRGLRNKSCRPDLIVLDDLDTDELCLNPARVRKAINWVMSALYMTFDPAGKQRFIALGNLIGKNSILAYLAKHPKATLTKICALENGKPAWKERYTVQQIQDLIETMGEVNAQKELFHNPISEGGKFKNEWIHWGAMLDYKDYDCILSYTDPSLKNTATSDYKATVVVGKKGIKYHIIKAYVERCTVSNMVSWHYDIFKEINDKKPVFFYMEANFIQDILFKDFESEAQKRGYHVPISKDSRKKPDKFQRIEQLTPLFERGYITFNEQEASNPGMNALIEQLLCIAPGSRTPDDAPDALEGAIYKLNERVRQEEPPVFLTRQPNGSKKSYW